MITAALIARNSQVPLKPCACGCGSLPSRTREGRPNKYLRGHHHKGIPKSESQRRLQSISMTGKPGYWSGKHHTAESRRKLSLAHTGKTLSAEHKHKIGLAGIGRRHTESQLAKKRGSKDSLETRLRKSLAQRGDKGSNWRGGISTEHSRIRASAEYKVWRKAVFARDDHTCRSCGARNGNGQHVDLHAHHVKRFADFPELRFVVDNGLTLCVQCHDKIHDRLRKAA